MKTLRTLILCLLALAGAATATAADYYARGVAHCILDDGTGNFPIAEAGEVFVSTTADATPQWTAGTFTSATISGPHSTSTGSSVSFYFWARAKAGYTFIGWATSKTSKTPSSGTADLEGQPWSSKTTFWSAKTEAAPNELVRYAIFRKNAAEDTTGGGVALSNIVGDTHTFGSTTGEWSVRLNYSETLAYRDFAGYADGYGANKALISSITCRNTADGTTVRIINARVGGSPTASPIGSDAYGLIFFPANMPVGHYTVHVPKGLFTTSTGKVTAAADFEVVVTPDAEPFTINSTSPTNGYAWDSSEATQTKETDGNFNTITLTFNKNIARVVTEGKEIVLTNTTTGRISKYTICSVSATTNKRLGVISFDVQPDGNYTFSLPADVFFDASGNGNAPFTLQFSIKGSTIAPWALPTYNTVKATPANNSVTTFFNELHVAYSRNGYNAPIALAPYAPAVRACRLWEVYEEGVDYSDPSNLPKENSEDIPGVTASIVDGELVVSLPEVINENIKVLITIPAGLVINIGQANSLSAQQLYERDGCTNAQQQILVRVEKANLTSVESAATCSSSSNATATEAYTLDGRPATAAQKGLRIIRSTTATGETNVRKVIVK